jgi:diguanylate cyclase (GGDEF)-like protein
MKDKNKHINDTGYTIEASPENVARLQRFILNVQSAPEIDALWRIYLGAVKEGLEIKEAHMTYRAGLLFEGLELSGTQITHKPITRFSFSDPKEDYHLKLSKKKLLVVKREDSHTVQMELKTKPWPDMNEAAEGNFMALLSLMTQIFMNQLFLLLRIKNFEYSSIKDDITLAYNQNYLKAFIQNEVERAKRYATVFSIIFFDLDNLKAINEIHGHLIGTEVLKEVAAILRAQVRKVDLLSRFGGDEFVIVLLHAGPEKAYEVCLRIRQEINNHIFLKSKNLNIHISGCFGISSFPENGFDVEELIRKSDLAMYDVKRKGKDGVKIYEEED